VRPDDQFREQTPTAARCAYGDLVSQGLGKEPAPSDDTLRDDVLDDEIALVGELVVAATHSDGPMSLDQIDHVLGLR
jgi:hypothetical protein